MFFQYALIHRATSQIFHYALIHRATSQVFFYYALIHRATSQVFHYTLIHRATRHDFHCALIHRATSLDFHYALIHKTVLVFFYKKSRKLPNSPYLFDLNAPVSQNARDLKELYSIMLKPVNILHICIHKSTQHSPF